MGRAKQLGPLLKLVLCICLPVPSILWPVVATVGSIIGGALYGFLSPIFATFDAVGEGKTNVLYHCFYVCLNNQVLILLFILSPLFFLYEIDFTISTFAGWNLGHC